MPSSPTLTEIVAETIRQEMAAKNVSGAKLALAIGKSDMYVSRRLRGETAFDMHDIELIAAELGVPISRFFKVGGAK